MASDDKNNKQLDIDSAGIRELASLMDETGLTEIEVTEGERSIRVSRGGSHSVSMPVHHQPSTTPMMVPHTPSAPSQDRSAPSEGTVKSPMVGTAYLRPEPGAAAYVSVGDTVKAGDTLLIIEAMKVMNQINADKGGRVMQIMVGDAQPVEFGEALMVIE